MPTDFRSLATAISRLELVTIRGQIVSLDAGLARVAGLERFAKLGDRVELRAASGRRLGGEVIGCHDTLIDVLPEDMPSGFATGDAVQVIGAGDIAPCASWIGRILDPFGRPLDNSPMDDGPVSRRVRATPPPAAERRPLGSRLSTGIAVFDTFLPLVRGQRLGLFAGSGVGKSTLLGQLARGLDADLAVVALIGERGRELRHFVETALGPRGMERSIVVTATSDSSPLLKRRAAWTATAIAEHFRDQGGHVLLLFDSVTRFAEAHREVALATGETAGMRGFPPSTSQQIMELVERAGPGNGSAGDITALYTVLVAGSDMDEPVADILRGVLDGHVVLDREIAERGRFPAVNVLRSVSRSLPDAATPEENALLADARRAIADYDDARLLVQSGLYRPGGNPDLDRAVTLHKPLERFLGRLSAGGASDSFSKLASAMEATDEESPPDKPAETE